MVVHNVAIEIEGRDKVGKDLIHYYLGQLGNYAYTINTRGILSQLVYNDKFDRHKDYTLYYKPLIILLDVDDLDHKIRCKMNKEPIINSSKDRNTFNAYAHYLESFGIKVLYFNTTELTPFKIAEQIINYMENKFDSKDYICQNPICLKSLQLYSKEDLTCEDVYYGNIRDE